MKLEATSRKVLAITKSKAKMYEFAIDEASHIALPADPRKLLITTIGILGELSAIEAREEQQVKEADEHEKLKSELRGLALPLPSTSSDQNELDKIVYLSSLHFGDEFIFTRSISLGILPHSSNIPNGIRVSVEWAMESNKSVLVVCTSTLAQGVNLPIRYLIVSSTFQAGQEITTRDFHNLIGRAGRAGYHTEGSVIFADTDVFDKRSNFRERWRWQRAMHLLDFTNAEDCASSLLDLIMPFNFAELNVDVISFICTQITMQF